MKLYIVQCSSGMYDDYHTWIDSVWDDASKAEERKEFIIAGNKRAIETPPPYPEEDIEFLSEEQSKLYDDWYGEWIAAIDENNPQVIEIELNQIDHV